MKNQELHLLYVFSAIMTEGSMTRAADRLAMTQPAVSNAVSRMRDLWKDPVFVKKGRNIEPTSYALGLWEQIRGPMQELSYAVDASHFEPETARRQFRIAIPDLTLDMIWPELVARLEAQAPGVDLHAVPYSVENAATQLREARIDLAIGVFPEADPSLRNHWLLSSNYVLAMRQGHPLANGPLTLEQFVEARHLLISLSGETYSFVDAALSRQSLSRRIVATVNHFPAIPGVLKRSDLMAVVPAFSSGEPAFAEGIHFTEVPLELEPLNVYLLWHTRHDQDNGLYWMRNLLTELIQSQWQVIAAGEDEGPA